MKQLLFIVVFLFASPVYAAGAFDVDYCETQAADYVTTTYNEVVTKSTRMPRMGDMYDPNIEVQVSTEGGGLYSVYYLFDCLYVRSCTRWR